METKDEIEIWRDVVGYEGIYQVSSLGRVKSLSRRIVDRANGFRLQKGKILKQRLRGNGKKLYYAVTLSGKSLDKTTSVHILEADAFIGVDPTKVTDHINNNTFDNRLCNLQRITSRENVSKMVIKKTSKYVGVCWHRVKGKWQSNIRIKQKKFHLGIFDNEEDASIAYQNALNQLKSNQQSPNS